MPKPTKRAKMICYFDAPSSYCQAVSASISFHIIPLGVGLISKRSPFVFQNESFYSPKGVLLHSKTNPFASQKDYIFNF